MAQEYPHSEFCFFMHSAHLPNSVLGKIHFHPLWYFIPLPQCGQAPTLNGKRWHSEPTRPPTRYSPPTLRNPQALSVSTAITIFLFWLASVSNPLSALYPPAYRHQRRNRTPSTANPQTGQVPLEYQAE